MKLRRYESKQLRSEAAKQLSFLPEISLPSYPLTLLSSFKRSAFTLAEVLITLAIIGVVAALIIPNFVQNYKKKVTEEKLKTAYSMFSQAVGMSVNENGSVAAWQYEKSFDLAEKYVLPYLKSYQKLTKTQYYTVYSLTEDIQYDSWPSSFRADRPIYALPSGMTFVVSPPCQNSTQFDDPHIIVDLNGSKAPNVMGADVFRFSIVNTNLIPSKRAYVYGACTKEMDHTRYKGGTCSSVIAKNGWKIPDNYPYKF